MVHEVAQIDVKPGLEDEFEAGVKQATPIFQRAKGCRGMSLHRSIENPRRFRLVPTAPRRRPTIRRAHRLRTRRRPQRRLRARQLLLRRGMPPEQLVLPVRAQAPVPQLVATLA